MVELAILNALFFIVWCISIVSLSKRLTAIDEKVRSVKKEIRIFREKQTSIRLHQVGAKQSVGTSDFK